MTVNDYHMTTICNTKSQKHWVLSTYNPATTSLMTVMCTTESHQASTTIMITVTRLSHALLSPFQLSYHDLDDRLDKRETCCCEEEHTVGVKELVGGGPRVEEGEGGEDEGGYYGRDNTCVLWGREDGRKEGREEQRYIWNLQTNKPCKQIEGLCNFETALCIISEFWKYISTCTRALRNLEYASMQERARVHMVMWRCPSCQ